MSLVKSMTGYGRAVETVNGREFTVELRSVNNRYLDCTVKLPRSLSFGEDAIKQTVKNTISRGKVKAWLGAVARNRAKSFLRSSHQTLPMDEDVLELPDASPENQALEKDLRRRLLAAVKSMPPVDKEIFLRYYYEYQTMEQISASMDIPVGTIKSRLSRGRRRLKQVIMEQEAEL